MFPLLTAGSLACLAGIAYWPSAIMVWAIIATVNISAQDGARLKPWTIAFSFGGQ